MNNKLRSLLTASVFVIVTLAAFAGGIASAEVSAQTDREGQYVQTHVIPIGSGVWSVRGRAMRSSTVLNPWGDRNGDRWPEIKETSIDPHYPWVIWPRRTGHGFDLAWSRWDGSDWKSVEWVESYGSSGDDLAPKLGFDVGGRPYVVWQREFKGHSTVYLSVFLATQWMPAYLVSEFSVDSRNPDIEVEDDGMIRVQYETPGGPVNQYVAFEQPVTITDDIDPQTHLNLVGAPQSVQEQQ